MSQVDLGKFKCDGCGKEYAWKPDYAGRKVKCKCGVVMTAPTEPPQPAAAEEDDLLGGLYDLAEEEKNAPKTGATIETGLRCPSCQAPINVGETTCTACGFNLKTGAKARAQRATGATGAGKPAGAQSSMLAYASANRRPAAEELRDSIGGSAVKELYVPGALVIAGLIGQGLIYNWNIPAIGIALIVNLVLSFVGVAIVAKLFELGFGAPGPAVLKMAAICLLPAAIATYIGHLVGSDSAFVRIMVYAILIMPLTEAGFMLLFDLAYDESIYCTIVIWLVNQWAVAFLVAAILSGAGSHLGGLANLGGPAPTSAVVKADEAAAEELTAPNATEANEWLKERVHLYAGETHDTSLALVKSMYDAGAKSVTTMSSSGEGYEMIIEMPRKSADRAKVIAAINARETAKGVPASEQTKDEGQQYHTISFSNIRLR